MTWRIKQPIQMRDVNGFFANVCGMKKGNERERRMAGFIAFHVGQIIRGSWSVINSMYDILFHNQSSST